jgi:hypothetical protein
MEMNGQAIGAQPLAEAGLRRLASEAAGPRPGAVGAAAAAQAETLGIAPRRDEAARARRP